MRYKWQRFRIRLDFLYFNWVNDNWDHVRKVRLDAWSAGNKVIYHASLIDVIFWRWMTQNALARAIHY